MGDGTTHLSRREPSDKDILEDDAVEHILGKVDPLYREFLTRHMMASERKAYNDGLEKGKTHECAKV